MLPKFFASVVAVFFVIQCHASNYYFSTSTGNDTYTSTQAQSKTTPWQTITKLNTFFVSLKPGDSVLFKCGETFTGTITITQSGTAAKPIIISSYGTGARPIISGLVPVTGWTSLGGNIYQGSCPLASATVNVTLLNNVPQQIGRYPNADAANGGFLNVDSHVNDTQITSSALATSVNWAGAEVVIRKNHWIIDRGIISSNTATVINYTDGSAYQPTNNFGFFIQNNINTLDENGEWYFNPTAKTLSMYLTTAPTNTSVQVSSTAYLVSITSKNYITINGLSFIGANSYAFNINTSIGFQILNSTINASGMTGIYALTTTNLVINNTSVLNSNNDGIKNAGAAYTNIVNDTVSNVGARAGMGQSGDGTYEGIMYNGKSGLISNNVVSNIGYDGVDFGFGDSTIVKNNYINNFELNKEDGGGIYTQGGDLDSLHNHYGIQIVNNIIAYTNGAPNGASGLSPVYASGIYMDANATGITISGNSISNCLTGVFFHESRNVIMAGNTIFNNTVQVYFSHNTTTYATKNNTVTNNIIYSEYVTQSNLSLQTSNVGVGTFSSFSNNYYSPSIDDIFQFNIAGKLLNLSLWQYLYGKDLGSVYTNSIPYYTLVMPSKRNSFANMLFTTNINGVADWSANGNFLAAWDNTGVLDGPSLRSYFSFQSGSSTNNPMMEFKVGAVTTTNVYMVKFSMIATHSNRRVMVYLMNNASPYNVVSATQYITLDSLRSENTIMISPTVACANTIVVLKLENEDVTVWIDNFGFYTTNSTLVNPATQIFYQFNATAASVNVKLSSIYVDAKNTIYKGSATIPAYSSLLLFKNADSTAVLPPVIYDAPPNTTKDIAAITTPPKAGIGVYPNPASDYIMLNFNSIEVKALNIKLINTRGDIILNQNVQVADSSYRLDLSQKPQPGCYFIQLSGSGLNQTSKVVII